MTEEKALFGFGVNDAQLFGETFETVDELIAFAQTEYDNENSDFFDDEDQYCIVVSKVEQVSPSDFAPSLDDIADQMTDSFYCKHNVDDDDVCHINSREEAEKEWKDFVEKYFELPGYTSVLTSWTIGRYNLKTHEWVEKFDSFDEELFKKD